MADKHAKLAKGKKKFSSKKAHDLTLEDVLAVGGDKVSINPLLFFQGAVNGELFYAVIYGKFNLQLTEIS